MQGAAGFFPGCFSGLWGEWVPAAIAAVLHACSVSRSLTDCTALRTANEQSSLWLLYDAKGQTLGKMAWHGMAWHVCIVAASSTYVRVLAWR